MKFVLLLPLDVWKVLEGYMALNNVGQLGPEITTAFASGVDANVMAVVRGVLLTRPGFEERLSAGNTLQELIKWLPPDLFRLCLAQVHCIIDRCHAHPLHVLQDFKNLQQHIQAAQMAGPRPLPPLSCSGAAHDSQISRLSAL